jgi:membrane protein
MLAVGVAVNVVLTIAMATLLFAAMFKILPDAKLDWKDTWVAAVITAMLFVVGKTLIGWYLQHSQVGQGWASAAASMVAMLVWVYYSSLIVLFGAELGESWARIYGDSVEPEDWAVKKRIEKKIEKKSTPAGVTK